MNRIAGSCRYIYNRALAEEQARHMAGEKRLGWVGLSRLLTQWRHDPSTSWLAQCPRSPQKNALRSLECAYRNFFAGRAGAPIFKKKNQTKASFLFEDPNPTKIKLDRHNGRISLTGIGWMRFDNHRSVLGDVRSVTVSEHGGRWFISILTKREVVPPVHSSTTAIGIDVGVVRFATLSDGSFVEPLNAFRKHEIRLAKLNRHLVRKKKGGKNYIKQRKRLAKLHAKIADVRNDFLHKTSDAISKNHAVVYIEDLKVRNMSVRAHRKNVRQKAGLNKAILDQGWGEFRRQLSYKCEWRGGKLIAVPPANTSRTCPRCEHIAKENRLTQAKFVCVVCSYENNADLVGALNIHAAGLAVSACGGSALSGAPAKQEPTEATRAMQAA